MTSHLFSIFKIVLPRHQCPMSLLTSHESKLLCLLIHDLAWSNNNPSNRVSTVHNIPTTNHNSRTTATHGDNGNDNGTMNDTLRTFLWFRFSITVAATIVLRPRTTILINWFKLSLNSSLPETRQFNARNSPFAQQYRRPWPCSFPFHQQHVKSSMSPTRRHNVYVIFRRAWCYLNYSSNKIMRMKIENKSKFKCNHHRPHPATVGGVSEYYHPLYRIFWWIHYSVTHKDHNPRRQYFKCTATDNASAIE